MAACVSCSSVRSRRVLAAILAFAAGQDGGKGEDDAVKTYRYDEMRKNILPLGLAAQGKITPPRCKNPSIAHCISPTPVPFSY